MKAEKDFTSELAVFTKEEGMRTHRVPALLSGFLVAGVLIAIALFIWGPQSLHTLGH